MLLSVEEFQNLSVEEIETRVQDLKMEHMHLRQKYNSNSADKDELIAVQRCIRHGLTVRQKKILEAMVEACKGKKLKDIPKELRPRLTRAKREALTSAQAKKVVRSVHMHRKKYPKVCYSYNENK